MNKGRGISVSQMKRNIDRSYGEKSWATLRLAIKLIYERGDTMSLSYEELYRIGYNMSMYGFGNILHDGLEEVIKEHLGKVEERISQAQQEVFLEVMKQEWDAFNMSRSQVRDILMYFDRNYPVKRRKMKSSQLSIALFRDIIISSPRVGNRLFETLFDQIDREREGEEINWQLLAEMTQMLVDLDPQGRSVYEHHFEKKLLVRTTRFYERESKLYLSECTHPEYMKRIERRILEESNRVERYLDRNTLNKLKWITEIELLRKDMEQILHMPNSGFRWMLENDQYEDIHRTYRLYTGIQDGEKMLLDLLRKEVIGKGMAIVTNEALRKDFLGIMDSLLALKAKYDKIIEGSFYGVDSKTKAKNVDKTFVFCVNEGFENFLNHFDKVSEYLSLYVDKLLRQDFKAASEDEVENRLNTLIALFRHLQEKDAFERFYTMHLSKRLLSGRSVSEDAERSFAVKLKEECGASYTHKMEGMFNDIKNSADIVASFREGLTATPAPASAGNAELNVIILTVGMWPVANVDTCKLPDVVAEQMKHFAEFYYSRHAGRVLKMHNSMGNAELDAHFGSEKHNLVVSTYQMCVLMLFNGADNLSYTEIEAATEIQESDLCRTLQSLACAKYKVLTKEPKGREINKTDRFTFNSGFTHKGYRLRIPTISTSKDADEERDETRMKIERDRKPQIEAAIVRIMKDRKTLDHNRLLTEVTSQLSAVFIPGISDIKERIESLIDREYLIREKERTYRYVA